ncbi:uncharacterized protein LOC143846273 [Tasmannia lanceolata]|uniref:uncharacterized protein LOC143846273 n=1 Tax=Tasmannia lanceolata TaxID=3420 RepID=UPI004062C712
MEADCYAYVKKCHKCQVYANLIHVPPSQLHSLTSPWPFSVTKWIEAASYASLTSASVARFIKANIICRYGGYQRRVERAFNKKVRVRDLKKGDLVLKSFRAPVYDPRGKFKPKWSGPYIVDEVLPEKAVRLLDENGEKLTEPTNLDQLKKYYA